MPPRKDFGRAIDGELGPVVVLIGEQSLLVGEAVARVRERALTAAPDFNRDELRAPDVTSAQIVAAAQTLPMMAERRYVHVADVHKLKAKEHPALIEYVKSPSPQTVLVLSGEKLDGRTKLGQALNKAKVVFAIEPPRPNELPGWLARRAKDQGISIAPDAAQLLVELVGDHVGALDTALELVSLYAGGPDETIHTEHVEACVAPTRVHSIFSLTDAIGERKLATASTLLDNALGGGESALMVLGMIVRQFRQLLQIRQGLDRGGNPRDVAQALGLRPFLVDSLMRQARQYRTTELVASLAACARADIQLKSTRLAPSVILGRLLVDVMGNKVAA